jgi:phosphoglycerate dehydrogenase-like enzyme
MTKLRIAVLDDYQGIAQDYADWSRLGCDADIVSFRHHLNAEEAAEQLQTFDVLCLMRERMSLPASLIEKLGQLKLIAVTGSHSQVIDRDAAARRGIPVVLTAPRASNSAAELTWALVLALARDIAVEDNNIRQGRWQTGVGIRLEGRTLGLLGLGTLGARVARYGQAFDMKVLAWSPNLDAKRAHDMGVQAVSKEELLKQSDVISIHLKLGDRSRGLMNADAFALMKPDAIFVNTSRSAIVDMGALRRTLEQGKLRGAGLDVFDIEPLPEYDPVRKLPRTILTPHIGFVTQESYRDFYAGLVQAIREWASAHWKH